MPLKPKLYKTNGKFQLKGSSTLSNPISMTPEQEEQFQVELYWCIKQLQTALGTGKLNIKQVQDYTKALNTLMSNTTSIVQKRQVMRLSFGNYREKIAAAEEKASKSIANIKLKPAKPDTKSVFVKKSMTLSQGNHNFKFNFEIPPEDEDETFDNQNKEEKPKQGNSEANEQMKCHYTPSNNSFRFNFELF